MNMEGDDGVQVKAHLRFLRWGIALNTFLYDFFVLKYIFLYWRYCTYPSHIAMWGYKILYQANAQAIVMCYGYYIFVPDYTFDPDCAIEKEI